MIPFFSPKQRARLREEHGFTLIESLLVVAMSALLGTAIVGTVMASLNVMSQVELNAADGGKNQKAYTDFAWHARNMDRLAAATSTAAAFTYRALNSCQMHVYSLESDPRHVNRVQLRHQITSVDLTGLSSCDSVYNLLISGTVSPQVDRIEANDLNPQSSFAWLNTAGGTEPRPGNATYDSGHTIPTCQLSAVSMTLYTHYYSKDTQVPDQPENVTVALLANARGTTC